MMSAAFKWAHQVASVHKKNLQPAMVMDIVVQNLNMYIQHAQPLDPAPRLSIFSDFFTQANHAHALHVTDFITFHCLVPPAAGETNNGCHWNQCEGDQAAHGYGAMIACALHGDTAVEAGRGDLALLINCNPCLGNLVKHTNQPHDISTHSGSFVIMRTAETDNVSDGTAQAGQDGDD